MGDGIDHRNGRRSDQLHAAQAYMPEFRILRLGVIPGALRLDGKLQPGLRSLGGNARRRGLGFSVKATQDNGAVTCSGSLTELLERSVRACQGSSIALPSGAGHDTVIVSSIAPVAMLFVRCRKGLSHHPDEYVHPRDLEMALAVVVDFLTRMAYQPAS